MSTIAKIMQREFKSYFTTPIGYIFIVVFLWVQWFFIFEQFNFFQSNRTEMRMFFELLPFTFIVFIPAVGMRLWSEERRTGTIEILLTLPVTIWQAVLGKFLAAWLFVICTILLSITFVFTLGWLGSPDYGVIIANYIGSFLIAGAYLALASFTSALTKNQIISMILSVLFSLIFLFIGHEAFLSVAKEISFFANADFFIDLVGSFGFQPHLVNIQKGVIDFRDMLYFLSFITAFLFLNLKLIESNKAK